MSSYVPVAFATILPHLGSGLGRLLIPSDVIFSKDGSPTWYDKLKRPTWHPPKWVFPPVWFGLYTAMGYASYLVWEQAGGFKDEATLPLIAYGSQLALNWIWSPVFFGAKNLKWGFFLILPMYGCVIASCKMFYDLNPLAGKLMMPLVGWLTLASCLSYRLWRDNESVEDAKKN